MSLTRSASGPAGGLTINTGAANAFGKSPTPQATSTGGLFGSGSTPSTTATTTAGGTGIGAGTGTTTMASNSLFGAAAKPPTGGSIFGQPTTTGTGTAGGSGLFGAANTNTQQSTTPAGGSSLFGNAAANTATNNQQQTNAFGSKPGGLFGNTTTAQPASAMGGGTSLFGQPAQNQQQTQQPSQTSSLFGGTTAVNTQNNTTIGNTFGQSQAKPAGTMFGQTQPQQSSTLGQSTNQVPAVQINFENIRPRTRFDDLAKPIQDEIALLDKGIMRVMKMKDEIGEFMPQHEKDIEQLGRDVKFVESKFRTVQVALNNDIQTVKALQDLTRKNAADARLAFAAADNLKLPTHYHQTGLFASSVPPTDSSSGNAASTHADAQDLITYFNRICDDIEKYKRRLDEYRGEIERDMPGVENGLYEQIRSLRDRSAGSVIVQDQLGEVLAALRETGNAIVAQAGQIADTRERLSRLQAGIVDTGVYSLSMMA